jgi:two-component system response regulator VicR
MTSKVLVIDDEKMMIDLIRISLSPLGFEVIAGEQTLDLPEKIKDVGADEVILDYLMPKKNGIDCAKEIREQFSELPILFLTSKQLNTDETKTIMALQMDYIRKPFLPQHLAAKLREALTRSTSS